MDRKNFASLKRIEDKYIATKSVASSIVDEVKKHFDVAYPDKSAKYTLIKSTYFDSPTATFYRDHLNDKKQRLKLRLRSYAPDGKWEDKFFLEVKGKNNDEIIKNRIQIDEESRKKVLKGEAIEAGKELISLNRDLLDESEIKKFVDRVNAAVKQYDLRPILTVTYRREAYQKGNDRVTVDQGISFKDEGGLSQKELSEVVDLIDFKTARSFGLRYSPDRNAVIEVKYGVSPPDWLESLFESHNLKETGFSKYLWCMYKMLTRDVLSNIDSGSDLFQALMGPFKNQEIDSRHS